MIKAVFFDIDGTLVSFETHKIPESAKEALRELRTRGVKCFIASGRPKYELQPCIRDGFEGFDGFDAYVTLTGSCCYDEDGVYRKTPLDPADVAAVVAQVEEGLYDVLAMTEERSYVSHHNPRICEIERKVGLTYAEDDIHGVLGVPVYQFCAFVPPEEEHLITDVAGGVFTTRWNDLFCDVVPKESSKPAGIAATLERFGIGADEWMAFGDGGNDATMLAAAHVGVCMGNGTDEARAAADYVTDSVDDDGIARALRHFGLI